MAKASDKKALMAVNQLSAAGFSAAQIEALLAIFRAK